MTQRLREQPAKRAERIAITGTGTVTPLGCSTWATALALRFRKNSWCEHETVLVADDSHGVVLRGATVSRVSEEVIAPDLDGAERAVNLLVPAIRECIETVSPKDIGYLDCRFDNFIPYDSASFFARLQEALPALRLIGQEQKNVVAAEFRRGAFFEQIISAAESLQKGHGKAAVIGTVDSLCSTSALQAACNEGTLKDSVTPEGIIAGEAAGALLLERESDACRRNAQVFAFISAWGRGVETTGGGEPVPSTGKGLTEAFFEAFSSLEDKGDSIGLVIADLNGQRARSLDWAYTEGRIFMENKQARELRHPAFTAGDCGGATGPLLIADALSQFAFHPRFPGRIAVSTSDEAGARRVVCLERGDRMDRSVLMEQVRKKIFTGKE